MDKYEAIYAKEWEAKYKECMKQVDNKSYCTTRTTLEMERMGWYSEGEKIRNEFMDIDKKGRFEAKGKRVDMNTGKKPVNLEKMLAKRRA